MTTDQVLAVLKGRGLEVVIRPDGAPALKGPPDQVTPALRDVLRWHRAELVARFAPFPEQPVITYQWRTGLVEAHRLPPHQAPTGAWWYRLEGEDCWRGVRGTPGEAWQPPANRSPADLAFQAESFASFRQWWLAKARPLDEEVATAVGNDVRSAVRAQADQARAMADHYRDMVGAVEQTAKELEEERGLALGTVLHGILGGLTASV